MKQESIDFRQLLERVLPIEQLPPPDRLRVERALQHGLAGELQQAALQALEQLEDQGALHRLPTTRNGPGMVMHYQPRDRFELITLELPGPVVRDGVVFVPRASLPAQALTGIDQIRLLLQLDAPDMLGDPRQSDPRAGLLQELDPVGRALVGAMSAGFHAAQVAGESGEPGPWDDAVALEAQAHPEAVLYCTDAWATPRFATEARRLGVRSLAWAAVTSATGEAFGHLEVRALAPDAYTPEALARIALLADYCASVLERAARIERLVFVDPATAAYNRSYFDLQARNEMARAQRERASVALCIADIDDFKAINTAYGYEAGNHVLARVAQSLRRAVRPFDTVARWGGEEFAVLLTSPVHAEDVKTVSERLRTAVERMALQVEGLDVRAHAVSVTVSIGVALFPEHAEDFAGLWRAANQALLEAKRGPKNQVVFYRA
jgi:diguanylate cyclase (GGDEF)-like protein